jgi:hypothetical protein
VTDGPLESEEVDVLESDGVDSEGSEEGSEASDEMESVEMERVDDDSDWMSEWASVYLVVWISSTRGVLKETFFSAGNLGLPDILRASVRRIGLFANIECRLCVIEYGMVAELDVDADDMDDELGVLDSWASSEEESSGTYTELSIESFGLGNRGPGVAAGVCSGSGEASFMAGV